jgi:UDP-2-acetamido-3-amino-2,3-dideoxy-glucuronate N-acetyltransferase
MRVSEDSDALKGNGEPVRAGVQASADVADDAVLGEGTSVWHLAQVRERAVLGENCIVGRGAYVGTGVRMGNNCKLQNYALVYEPAVLEDGVFVGPAVVLTNDHYPRSIKPDGQLKRSPDWDPIGVTVRRGASIGARSVCVAPVIIGAWALVAAGSVVIADVPDFALVAGVPARRLGWVGRAGVPLERTGEGAWCCLQTHETYAEREGVLALNAASEPTECTRL